MADDLAMIIDEARRRAFVGRTAELASFDALLDPSRPRCVLFVYGPGGIGKTTLLQQFRARARAAGRTPILVDGRDVDCSPEGFREALDRAITKQRADAAGSAPTDDGLDRTVLLLDGYERFGPLDGWIREEFLPSLVAGAVVVVAGRDPPSAPWRTDPGWRALVACHRLKELTHGESVELLQRAGVADDALASHLAALGQGHPLTLALLADTAASGSVPDDLAGAPDLVAALVAQIVGDVPSEAHATGLAICAHAWIVTEDLLRVAIGDRAPEIWAWLETRPFVNRGPNGLYAHDLVGDVLDADFRRRSPEAYARVNRNVHLHAIAALRRSDATERQLWACQKLYLHRRSPFTVAFWTLRTRGSAAVVAGHPDDHPGVLQVIERFEGRESAALAERWLDTQPENLAVVRSPDGIAGFIFQVVYPTDPWLCHADPIVRAVLEEVARTSPVRPGEQITVGRFLAGAADHQRDGYAVLAGSVTSIIDWAIRPLAWSFVAALDADYWGPRFRYLGFTTEFAVEFAGRVYTVYGIDWRPMPIEAWLELMSEREITGATGPPPAALLRPQPLDQARFAEAVRAALRDLHQPDRLRGSPLMGSRLAVGFEGAAVSRLRATMLAAIGQVGRGPRASTLHRVLDRTFVHAAPTQEAAAEVLDLPFSTYRRHLAKAVERLTDLLWAVEIGEVRLDTQPGLT